MLLLVGGEMRERPELCALGVTVPSPWHVGSKPMREPCLRAEREERASAEWELLPGIATPSTDEKPVPCSNGRGGDYFLMKGHR